MRKIIRSLLILVCIGLLILAVSAIYLNEPKNILKQYLNHAQNNDSQGYIFYILGGIPVGQAKITDLGLTSYDHKSARHICLEARPLSLVAKFYNAYARIDSYIDNKALYTLKFSQVLAIPNRPENKRDITYDQKNNIMVLLGKEKRTILPQTQDMLSALYFIRQQEFAVNKTFELNINTNQKNYRFDAVVVKQKEYSLLGKQYKIWQLNGDIRRRDNNPRHNIKFRVWFLDDPAKTPLLFKAMTIIGPVSARLAGNKS